MTGPGVVAMTTVMFLAFFTLGLAASRSGGPPLNRQERREDLSFSLVFASLMTAGIWFVAFIVVTVVPS